MHNIDKKSKGNLRILIKIHKLNFSRKPTFESEEY